MHSIRSSPGGQFLQDYHWSGGFYSPEFTSYDRFEPPNFCPKHVYGPKMNTVFPSDEYGSLEIHPQPIENTYLFPKTEYFDKNQNNLIVVILLCILFVYFLEKLFGTFFTNHYVITGIILFFIVVLMYGYS